MVAVISVTDVGIKLKVVFWPGGIWECYMVYNDNYNFSPVVSEEKLIGDDLIVQAREATDEDLLVVHTRRYLNKLKVLYLN